jgi:glucose/arabinose dehydrogenase
MAQRARHPLPQAVQRWWAAGIVVAMALAGCSSGGGSTTQSVPHRGVPALQRVGRFDHPVYVAQPPRGEDGPLYVVEREGRLRAILPDGSPQPRPVLDIHRRVYTQGEGAMISVAFPHDFESSRLFYVTYAGRDHRLHLDEFRMAPDGLRASPSSRRPVLAIDHPNDVHWGGLATFGPDGLLYLSTGDGGPPYPIPTTSQDPGSLLGKILRIDPRRAGGRPYTVPRGNPFVGRRGADQVLALGLRNPWRYSFDSKTGDLWIGDVGDFVQEEIDHLPAAAVAGANFGWPNLEGTAPKLEPKAPPGAIPPVLTYERTGKPDDPYCAVTGGYVERDPAVPSLGGRYLYGDFCKGVIRSLKPDRGHVRDDRSTGLEVPKLASFGEDASGRLYAVSLDGPVYRIVER